MLIVWQQNLSGNLSWAHSSGKLQALRDPQVLSELAAQPRAGVVLLLDFESGTAVTETDVEEGPCVLLVNGLFLFLVLK